MEADLLAQVALVELGVLPQVFHCHPLGHDVPQIPNNLLVVLLLLGVLVGVRGRVLPVIALPAFDIGHLLSSLDGVALRLLVAGGGFERGSVLPFGLHLNELVVNPEGHKEQAEGPEYALVLDVAFSELVLHV